MTAEVISRVAALLRGKGRTAESNAMALGCGQARTASSAPGFRQSLEPRAHGTSDRHIEAVGRHRDGLSTHNGSAGPVDRSPEPADATNALAGQAIAAACSSAAPPGEAAVLAPGGSDPPSDPPAPTGDPPAPAGVTTARDHGALSPASEAIAEASIATASASVPLARASHATAPAIAAHDASFYRNC